MPRQQKFIQLPLVGKVFLCLLAIVYLVYLVALVQKMYPSVSTQAGTIVEHPVNIASNSVVKHWTKANMLQAHIATADQQVDNTSTLTQGNSDITKGKAAQQQGQAPANGDLSYPLSTVGKVFFTNDGLDYVCSGTAVISINHSVVDTAGHCLYWGGSWAQNVIFCPLYDNGNTPYDCWVARDLEVPSDWITPQPNDYHHDMGMAIVAANSAGNLTDIVGGAGWAYNQSADQPFYAYGYPAGYPFDGQTRKTCEASTGTVWPHGGGTVISIPCDMTGGSSGGPWFIKIGNNLYLNGHNDFTSSMKYGHMFSPYYDDTWYALYDKAQHS